MRYQSGSHAYGGVLWIGYRKYQISPRGGRPARWPHDVVEQSLFCLVNSLELILQYAHFLAKDLHESSGRDNPYTITAAPAYAYDD